MARLIWQATNKRGEDTENQTCQALEMLKNEGKIRGFYRVKKWSRQDRRNIDAVVFLNDNSKVFCQIKSSLRGVKECQEELKKFDTRDIVILYGRYLPNETPGQYKERIFREITKILSH